MQELPGCSRCKRKFCGCSGTNTEVLEGEEGIEFQPLLFIGESRVLRLLRG